MIAHVVAVSSEGNDEILRGATVALALIFYGGAVDVGVRHHVMSVAHDETCAEQLGLWLTGGVERTDADDAWFDGFDRCWEPARALPLSRSRAQAEGGDKRKQPAHDVSRPRM